MAWTITAMAAFLEGYLRDQRLWYRLGFVACGLAVLARGPIGAVYPLGALVLFFILFDRKGWRKVPWATGFLLLLGIGVPWYALMEIKYSGFLDLFIVKHHFNRLLPAGSHAFVAEPRWQILLGFLGFLGPMALLLPWAVTKVSGERSANHMLWLLSLLVMGSVMISTGRNHPYTFPALPPLVAIVAGWLGVRTDSPLPSSPGIPAVLVGLLGIAVLCSIPWMDDILREISPLLEDSGTRTTVKIAMVLVAASIVTAGLFLWRGHGVGACVALALVMLPGAYMLVKVQKQTASVKSRVFLAKLVEREVPPTWPVFIANPRDHLFEGVGGWGFYAHRQVRMVAFDPPVGPFQGVSRPEWIVDVNDFEDLWKSKGNIVLAATPEALAKLPFGDLPAPQARDQEFGLWIMPQGRPRGIRSDSTRIRERLVSLRSPSVALLSRSIEE
jgi:4-amino-4-deoxy-L-arabinose transferase-like glycosyltransferase